MFKRQKTDRKCCFETRRSWFWNFVVTMSYKRVVLLSHLFLISSEDTIYERKERKKGSIFPLVSSPYRIFDRSLETITYSLQFTVQYSIIASIWSMNKWIPQSITLYLSVYCFCASIFHWESSQIQSRFSVIFN